MSKQDYGIHWFRRDLRVAGNNALRSQLQECEGRVVGVFCFDKKFLARKDFSVNRFQFFLNSLVSLKKELQDLGSDLLVLDVGPDESLESLFKQLQKSKLGLPTRFSWNRDYEPFAIKRDKRIKKLCESFDIESIHFRDHLLIEPDELTKDDGDGYKVYTPFSRKWLEIFESEPVQKRMMAQKNGLTYLKKLEKGNLDKAFSLTWKKLLGTDLPQDVLEAYVTSNQEKVDIEIPEAGSLAALSKLKEFKKKIDEYGDKRDIPSIAGTSKFSMYLKNGTITVPQIIAYFQLTPYKKKKNSRDTFFSELIWREFYYHILYRHPHVEKKSFNPKYEDLKWENDKKLFKAWCEGKTGFPIVDAGMRELNQTGWMHNRVRMIVASFLTKDLLIDWRWGEQYFMEKLLDGDLAPNNGGWQWAASTGCDAQPYFRIFNPWLQSKRFDPEGEYIKTYIPELSDIPAKQLHKPILGHDSYPEPIVDHSEQRDKALKLYKEL
ncbi:MAG: deoxyribodipyrimidine photolyase [Halobacteriovoraceae bacterium]|nr:deoxyribodipyrimidine photolyase [Halobacteriovoraceae bacterium]|tara:strand:+ start:5116 stop:6591 length:1476 start_codon:yes stop_codon:yes gene_type:complete